MPQTTIHNIDNSVRSLSKDELDQLFHIFKENAELFAKVMPPTPFFQLLKDGKVEQAYSLMQHAYSSNP